MLKIKDRVYGTNQATLYLDDQLILSDYQYRVANVREKFITSVYKLLQSEENFGSIQMPSPSLFYICNR